MVTINSNQRIAISKHLANQWGIYHKGCGSLCKVTVMFMGYTTKAYLIYIFKKHILHSPLMESNPNYYMTSLGTTRNQTKARGQEPERENVPKNYQAKKIKSN